jgi:predicted phosphodiesterase
MTHIAGKPYVYSKGIPELIKLRKPDILICGHSHILRVERDKKFNFLYMNPGAAGYHGFHKVRTMLRFNLNAGKIENMEVVELGPRTQLMPE